MRRFLSILLILSLLCASVPVMAEGQTAEDELVDEADDIYGDYVEEGYTELKRGDRDADEATAVLRLQQALIEIGYLSDAADGVYGGNTELAVAAFQRNNELQETGTADVATLEKLYSGKDLVTADNAMDEGSIITRVQRKLGQWGFYAGRADGVAGDATNEAIIRFKKYLKGYYLVNPTPSPVPQETATPKPTPVTSGYGDAVVAEDELLVPEGEEAGPDSSINSEVLVFVDGEYDFEVYRQNVANGEKGDEVDRVQRRLHALNYLSIMDGELNAATERALLYFQKKNSLTLTGIADEATQRCLFSAEALAAEEYVNAYKLVVNKTDQRVYVYQWNGSDYSTKVKEFICSTGMKGAETETPAGTFAAVGPSGTGEWYYFKKYECYAKWGYFIVGGIMFHSVIYSRGKVLNRTSVSKLGRRASHGCIRLEVESAKWIYNNCPKGTTVVITN